jgi:hypothetical protein
MKADRRGIAAASHQAAQPFRSGRGKAIDSSYPEAERNYLNVIK